MARDTVAYWLEDDLGSRVSTLSRTSERPTRLAGRILENIGSLTGWTLLRRDSAGERQVVATGPDLEVMAMPFVQTHTAPETETLRGLNQARRALGFRRAKVVTDERVY